MKSRFIIAILLVIFLITLPTELSSQTIELNGFTGIHLGGTARLYDGDFRINDAQNYGGKLAIGVSSTTSSTFKF